MRLDLSPLYRTTVGFDRMFSLLDGASDQPAGYPPYNIEKTGENAYRVSVAVAGFAESELSVEVREQVLTVKGLKANAEGDTRHVLFQGIAGRSFERRFQLADHVQVAGANLEHGLLNVDLVREIPEAAKPRQIAIASTARPAAIEQKAAA